MMSMMAKPMLVMGGIRVVVCASSFEAESNPSLGNVTNQPPYFANMVAVAARCYAPSPMGQFVFGMRANMRKLCQDSTTQKYVYHEGHGMSSC
jgi:hypothetical protein